MLCFCYLVYSSFYTSFHPGTWCFFSDLTLCLCADKGLRCTEEAKFKKKYSCTCGLGLCPDLDL